MRKNTLKEPLQFTSTEGHETLIKVTTEGLLRDLRDDAGRMRGLEVFAEPVKVAVTTIDDGCGILSGASDLDGICDEGVLVTDLPRVLYDHREVCCIRSKDNRKMKVVVIALEGTLIVKLD